MTATKTEVGLRYMPAQQAIINYWSRIVGMPGTMVMLFINERTYRFKKEAEHIPRRAFLGEITISDNDGDIISTGLALSWSSIMKHVSALEQRDLIAIHHDRNHWTGNIYSFNWPILIAPMRVHKVRGRRIKIP